VSLSGQTKALPFGGIQARFGTRGDLILAAALPIVFLSERFQPGFTLHLGATQVDIRLADLAVVSVAFVAAVVAKQQGLAALRAGRAVWITAAAFLAFTFVATFYPLGFAHGYPWKTHLVTAFKYSEYALLAPAVPLLVRTGRQVHLLMVAVTALSAVATLIGLLQFGGVHILAAWPAGGRQPSFVGVDDFGALSAATYVLAVGCVAAGPHSSFERRLAWTAGVAGGLGVICSGSLAAVLGSLLAAGAAAAVSRRWHLLTLRRGLALALMAATMVGGGIFMRGTALTSFAHFLGVGHTNPSTQVESYSQRWVLDYIGFRMFAGHPVLGTGWASGYDQEAYGPYLAAARARFPSQPPLAFPSPEHPWGIQNAYVQTLAELGIVGFALFVTMILTGLGVAGRQLRGAVPAPNTPALIGLLWLLVAAGVWNSLWLIAGIPFDALIWLAFGFAATAVPRPRRAADSLTVRR
jgi:hypothetical protein